MPLPIKFPSFIYGIHDPGNWMDRVQSTGRQGWVLYTEEVRENTSGNTYSASEQRGFGVLVRLNWGYGDAGTIPAPARYDVFADHCRQWVANSSGGHIWIIGNEMNLAAEWPGGPSDANKITPQTYADCFGRCRNAIRSVAGHRDDLVLAGAVAPYNNQTAYPSNPTGDWVRYFQDLLGLLGPNVDGITLHTYTHGPQAALITNEAKMNPPFDNRRFHFRAYRDFLQVVPPEQRGLPVFITEAEPAPQSPDPCHNGGWLPAETAGWVTAAYKEVDEWNRAPGNQAIQGLILFRWNKGCDSWSIQDKDWVVADFNTALNAAYRVTLPGNAPAKSYRATFMNDNVPSIISADGEVQVNITVRNDSNFAWLADGATSTPVRIGFRWFNGAGQEVPARDGPRTSLPRAVTPGETVSVSGVRIIAPPAAGTFVLRLDMLEEGATWFGDAGSAPRNVTVTVRSPVGASPGTGYAYTVVSARLPDTFARDASAQAVLSIRNDGYKTWRASGANPVTLGFKWFRPGATQETLVRQLVRASLPRDVSTGDVATVSINVLAPFSPGAYALVFDLVEEGITEFRAAGAQPFSKDVTVTAPPYYVTWNSSSVPATLNVDQNANVTLNVRNDGGKMWKSGGPNPTRLAYTWYDRRGQQVLVRQDIRTAVPRDVAPGEAVDLTIGLLAPDRPGNMTVRFDMIEEGITSFQDQGSPPLAKGVSVTAAQDYQVTFGEGQLVVAPHAPFAFNLRVRNDGNRTWAAGGSAPVKIGYHWFDANNQPVPAAQDFRTPLPADMLPGDELVVQATGFAPDAPGRYRLQWSLVIEGLAWFYDLRARALDVPVEVAHIGAPLPRAMLDLPSAAADTPYRATFAPVDFVVGTEPGAQRVVTFKVRNDGTKLWPKSGANPVHAGYRWYQGSDAVPVALDMRTELPGDIAPGQTAIFGATIVAPQQPDIYELRIDLVEEGVTWFADTGTSQPLSFAVRVAGAAPGAQVRPAVEAASAAGATVQAATKRWSASEPGAAEAWLQCDLGGMRTVDALTVRLATAAAVRADVSADGTVWVTVGAAEGSELRTAFAPASARYVRVARTNDAAGDTPGVAELLVHEAPAWRAIASPNGEMVGLAFDNDPTTAWTTGDSQLPGMQFTLDLGAVQTVAGLSLDNGTRAEYPQGHLIQVSADGQRWAVVSDTANGGNTGPVDVKFDARPVRYISIECTATQARPWTIAEFRVRRLVTDWSVIKPDA